MPLETRPCKGCGKPIVRGVTADGKRIPLDPRAAVYQVLDYGGRVQATRTGLLASAEGVSQCMVTHFATCPKASEF